MHKLISILNTKNSFQNRYIFENKKKIKKNKNCPDARIFYILSQFLKIIIYKFLYKNNWCELMKFFGIFIFDVYFFGNVSSFDEIFLLFRSKI